MWRSSWLLPLFGAVLLTVLAGCGNPSSPTSTPRERPAPADKDRDHGNKPPEGGVKPPSPDPG
jgi:hypothetical protein